MRAATVQIAVPASATTTTQPIRANPRPHHWRARAAATAASGRSMRWRVPAGSSRGSNRRCAVVRVNAPPGRSASNPAAPQDLPRASKLRRANDPSDSIARHQNCQIARRAGSQPVNTIAKCCVEQSARTATTMWAVDGAALPCKLPMADPPLQVTSRHGYLRTVSRAKCSPRAISSTFSDWMRCARRIATFRLAPQVRILCLRTLSVFCVGDAMRVSSVKDGGFCPSRGATSSAGTQPCSALDVSVGARIAQNVALKVAQLADDLGLDSRSVAARCHRSDDTRFNCAQLFSRKSALHVAKLHLRVWRQRQSMAHAHHFLFGVGQTKRRQAAICGDARSRRLACPSLCHGALPCGNLPR